MINNSKIRLQPLFTLSDEQNIIGYEVLYSKGDAPCFPSATSILKSISLEDSGIDNFKYYINMTTDDAVNPSFISDFLKTVDEVNVDRNRIVLELNEDTAVSELSKVKQNLVELSSNGIQIALDDFGTNFSTLEFMSSIPLDIVKIDKKFVQQAIDDYKKHSLLKFCVEVSHDIGCLVIAEGIENEKQMESSITAGADVGQGFIFSVDFFNIENNNRGNFEKKYINNVSGPFIPLSSFRDYLLVSEFSDGFAQKFSSKRNFQQSAA